MAKTRDISLAELLAASGEARRLLVKAHNAVQRELYTSVLGQLLGALPVDGTRMPNHSAPHYLLSDYAFWGAEELVGRRAALMHRFGLWASGSEAAVAVMLREATFGAWEPTGASGRWRMVGPPDTPVYECVAVTDPLGKRVDADDADAMRVGWVVETPDGNALVFSTPVDELAAGKLRRAAGERAWEDPTAEAPARFHRIEYEGDLLSLLVAPDYDDLGLGPYFFLPIPLRANFPQRFGERLFRELVGRVGGGWCWHLEIARARTPELREAFDIARERAARWARGRGRSLDASMLRRLIDDEAILAVLGAQPDASVPPDGLPPVKLHPLNLLDLSREWFEQACLSPSDLISHARTSLEGRADEGDAELLDTLERAVADHEVRIRWVSAVRRALRGEALAAHELLDGNPEWLAPTYNELREVIDTLFASSIGERPLEELLPSTRGCARRVCAALRTRVDVDGPIRVHHLPEYSEVLRHTRGIGRKSADLVERSLRDALLAWPPGLEPHAPARAEAHDTLADGLDQLDALFGG